MTNVHSMTANRLGLPELIGADTLPPGAFGAVLARAGVGKTALIVQAALTILSQGKHLLHISLNEPIAKVDAHYREVFDRLAKEHRYADSESLWDDIIRRRFIMTFQVEGFSVPKLEERLTDLSTQDIFHPQVIIIDRLPFENDVRSRLTPLKTLAVRIGAPIWFTITTHRHESPAGDGLPIQISPVQDLFELAVGLQPTDNAVGIHMLKGGQADTDLVLDPTTMLIRKQ